MPPQQLSAAVEDLIKEELQYSVGGVAPLPAFIVEAKGAKLWDVNGKEYIDFLCMFSAVNQGHSHPVIVKAVSDQLTKAALVNASTHTAAWPSFARMMCQRFGYDKITSMVSGTEAVDGACKIARKWAITRKQVPPHDVIVLGVSDCYHGLASGVWGLQNPGKKRLEYGIDDTHLMNYNPSTGSLLVYGDIAKMAECLSEHHNRVAAVILECIRGQLPTFEQEIEYAQGVQALCKKFNILFIADEIRMGMAKTGKFLCSDHLGPSHKPDMITLGKSVSGGLYPTSYVLGMDEAMSVVGGGELLSTFAFSPIAIAATTAALRVTDEENLAQQAIRIGEYFLRRAKNWEKHAFIEYVTARGADLGIWLTKGNEVLCRKISALCMHKGLLLYPSPLHVRISVPMIIEERDLERGLDMLEEALDECLEHGDVPGMTWRGKL